jgi:hypothetical protein
VGEVPQEAQRRLLLEQTRFLLSCWVHAKAECLASEHGFSHRLVYVQVNRLSQRAQGARSEVARGQRKALGRSLLVAELLRGVVWRSPARDRQALRRTTTRRGFLPALKDGVSAPEIR